MPSDWMGFDPTSDASTGIAMINPASPTTHWDKVKDFGGGGDTDYVQHGASAGYDTYTINGAAFTMDVPHPGATIDSVDKVQATVRGLITSGSGGNFKGLIMVYGGGSWQGPYYTDAYTETSATDHTFDWNTNPYTSAAWTVDDIQNSLRTGCYCAGAALMFTRVFTSYLKVYYTYTDAPASTFIPRIVMFFRRLEDRLRRYPWLPLPVPAGYRLRSSGLVVPAWAA